MWHVIKNDIFQSINAAKNVKNEFNHALSSYTINMQK